MKIVPVLSYLPKREIHIQLCELGILKIKINRYVIDLVNKVLSKYLRMRFENRENYYSLESTKQ